MWQQRAKFGVLANGEKAACDEPKCNCHYHLPLPSRKSQAAGHAPTADVAATSLCAQQRLSTSIGGGGRELRRCAHVQLPASGRASGSPCSRSMEAAEEGARFGSWGRAWQKTSHGPVRSTRPFPLRRVCSSNAHGRGIIIKTTESAIAADLLLAALAALAGDARKSP